ncbi:MAG TPA: FAD-dependent oxidoreductase [Dehalococcoidia bacterium]|nr:FAD-dependent oxidoreductase [Dehalococcoidia bacterium]
MFKVKEEACIACEACLHYCPMGAISIKDNRAHIDQDECVECGLCQRAGNTPGLFKTPCSYFCPAGIDVPRYVQFIAEGKPEAALAVVREKIPFPAICGLVCFHPCEARCARSQVDEAVSIRALKRFAWEHGNGMWKQQIKVSPASGKRVAIIGSGPAGLTAAYYLAKLGHAATVFEAQPEPGGMMMLVIPEYRLPKDVIRAEIKEIEGAGVEIKTNTKIDSIDQLFKEGYDAVFIATGAQQGRRLGIEGEDSPQVMQGISFLRKVKLGDEVKVGSRVAVIGGGNCAIDAARTALRLGGKEVTIFYRRSQAEMPATTEEFEEALVEGVKFRYLAAPSRILTLDDREVEIEFVRTRLEAPDESGRRRPRPIEGSEFVLRFDTVIVAIGQCPEIPSQFDLPLGQSGVIQVDWDTLATARKGVFAGGDVVTGPASIIEAISAGRQGAISIDKYLGGNGDISEVLAPAEEAVIPPEEVKGKRRSPMPTLGVEQRMRNFRQVELGYSPEMAIEEAKRCLRCDLKERNCIIFEPSDWPRSLRHHFSQPGVPHETTGIAGRGTEEMKTNDVTGRFRRGWVGLGLDVGRPGIGAHMRDVEILTRALAKLGVQFEAKNPITMMMEDPRTGKLREDILKEKVMSCVVEALFPIAKLEQVLRGLREATAKVNTVVSVCAINRADPDGTYPLRRKLDELGIPYYINGKQNAGLGRPLADI